MVRRICPFSCPRTLYQRSNSNIFNIIFNFSVRRTTTIGGDGDGGRQTCLCFVSAQNRFDAKLSDARIHTIMPGNFRHKYYFIRTAAMLQQNINFCAIKL